MSTRIRLPIVVLFSALLAGCGMSGSYPSLAPRPEELAQAGPPAPPPAAVPAASDPALRGQIDRLLADARSGDVAFRAALPATEKAVAAAGAAGSDSWAEAQQALSRLEAARASTAVSAAELDAMARARAEAPTPAAPTDITAINAAAEQVGALAASQDEAITRLSGRLASI